ncbi:patatin-like phospholipase family protein [candidate division WOR-3 bacterium]|nr:patatin-like phospholipase family protein [candidate division WOR-3 bacterium]
MTITSFFPKVYISGFIGGSMLERFLNTFLEDLSFNDLKFPFFAVATDIESGREVIICEDPVKKTVRASMSLPVIFIPVRHNGQILVDGGLVNPLPVSIVKERGADIIIACNVIPKVKKNAKSINLKGKTWKFPPDFFLRGKSGLPNMKKIFFQSLSIMENEILTANLQKARPTILIEPEIEFFNSTAFHKAKEIITYGEKTMKNYIPSIKRMLNKNLTCYELPKS